MVRIEHPEVAIDREALTQRHRPHLSIFSLPIVLLLIIPAFLRSEDKPQAPGTTTTAVKVAKKAAEIVETRLFVTNADGSNPKLFTDLPDYIHQGSPEWSADGKLVCFDAWKVGGTFATGRIIVTNADGTNPRILSDGCMPSLSPKGNRIAFCRSGDSNGIWIMSTKGPEVELLEIDSQGWGTSWSPDGRVAYASQGPGGGNLTVVDITEGTREFLLDEERSPYSQIRWNFAWSPNGKRIVFKGITKEGKPEVGIVDTRGQKFGLIRRPAYSDAHDSFTWSADGSRVIVSKPCAEQENRQQLYSFNPDRDEPMQLMVNQDPKLSSITAAASPDGKKLVISSSKPLP